jgi:hypothetical protein
MICPLILRSRVRPSRPSDCEVVANGAIYKPGVPDDGAIVGTSWFETRETALLTMRV